MITWLLLATFFNSGSAVTVIDRFTTEVQCEAAAKELKDRANRSRQFLAPGTLCTPVKHDR